MSFFIASNTYTHPSEEDGIWLWKVLLLVELVMDLIGKFEEITLYATVKFLFMVKRAGEFRGQRMIWKERYARKTGYCK